MLRWIILTCIAFTGFLTNGQPLDYFCDDTASIYADEEVAEVVQFLMPVVCKEIYLPGEVVERLLSHEVLDIQINEYSCLSLAYHIWLADALRDMGVYEEAGKYAQRALEIANESENEYISFVLSLLASIAYQDQDFDSAIEYYKANLDLVKKDSPAQSLAGAYNNLALAYLEVDSLQRATGLFNMAFDVLDSTGMLDTHVGAAILDNLAQTALTTGDTLRAFDLLTQKSQTLERVAPDTIRIIDTWISLAQLHLLRKEVSQAQFYLSEARAHAENYSSLPLATAFQLESLWFDYLTLTRQHAAMESSMHQLRSLFSRYADEVNSDRVLLSDAMRNYAQLNVQQVRQLAEIQLEKQAQKQRFQSRMTYLWFSLGLLLILCVAGYFYYRNVVSHQRIRSLNLSVSLNEQKLRNEKLEKELIQSDLDARGHDLTSLAMDNIKRREWTAEIIERLDSALAMPPDKRLDEIKKIYFHLRHQYQIQERLSIPQVHHELINKSFFNRLKSDFPNLTKSEIDLCGLMRLGLSGKEIAVVRNVDPESIRKAKYRLRKNMDFPTPEALQDYLLSP